MKKNQKKKKEKKENEKEKEKKKNKKKQRKRNREREKEKDNKKESKEKNTPREKVYVFPVICGSGGSNTPLWHMLKSKCKKTPGPDHFGSWDIERDANLSK